MHETTVAQTKQQGILAGALVFSILAAVVVAFGAVLLSQQLLQRAPAYPEFIVGAITWDAATKFQDLASYPAFVLGFLVGGWVSYRLFQHVSSIKSHEYGQAFITMLTWWLVPVAIGLGGFLSIYPSDSSFTILVGAAGAAISAVAVRLHLSRGDATPQQIGIGVLSVMLIGLLPFGIAAIQDRLPLFGETFRFGAPSRVSVFLVIAAALYLFYLCRSASNAISRHIPKLLLIGQLGIAPLYLLILPDLYRVETGEPAIQATVWLWLLGLGAVLATVIDVVVRYKKFVSNQEADLMQLFSPVAMFATIVLLRNGATVIPHVPGDDYHFGESLLGWWSLWEFGQIPYIDYFPPHGFFGDDIGGFISLIFYDGTAATIAEADRLAATLTMFAAFMAMRIYTGSLGLAYVSVLLFGIMSRKLIFLILVPFYCLWLKASEWSPQRWLWVWLISAIVLVLLVPPQGLLAAVSSLPLVALYLYRARQADWKRELLLLALFTGALWFFTPVLEALFGAVRYVLENGAVNQIAYGVPWAWSWIGTAQGFVSWLELLRMSWVWVPLIAAVLIVAMFRQRERWPYLIGVALPVLLFGSLITSYTMGRIDLASMSRPGTFANFAWASLLPILLAPLLASRGRAVLAVAITFVCAGIGIASVNKVGLRAAHEKNQIGNLWAGAEHGLKNMGTGLVEPPHVDRLERINRFLSSYLAPRETYLDLTGRNAQYMYFDRPPPISTTAPYNLAPIKQQQRAVEQLNKAQPRIALLEADSIHHDGGGMALRTHLLYRFVLKHYDAELHDGFVYGIAKNADLRRSGISFSLHSLTDQNWEGGVHRSDNAIVIRDPISVRYLAVGDIIVLPDNKPRKITRVWPEGNAVWFDGARFVPNVSDNQREIQVVVDAPRRKKLSAQLMDHVFAVADLRKVPVAWGQSVGSLSAVMKHIVDLDVSHAGLHELTQEGASFRVSGSDPYLWLDLTQQKIAGESAGLLKFDVSCVGLPNPQLRIFWWGDDMQGSDPSQSLVFTADNGTVIVPLDAYPGWLGIKQVKGLRIDLETPSACQTLSIQHASLHQRVNLSE
ncbi:MAG: hypothetical protein WAW41_16345 [Methylobacter sp.]